MQKAGDRLRTSSLKILGGWGHQGVALPAQIDAITLDLLQESCLQETKIIFWIILVRDILR